MPDLGGAPLESWRAVWMAVKESERMQTLSFSRSSILVGYVVLM